MKKICYLFCALLVSMSVVSCEGTGVFPPARDIPHFTTLAELLEEIDSLQRDTLATLVSSDDSNLNSLVQKVRELREFGQELQELSTTRKNIVLGRTPYSTVEKAQEALESQLATYRTSYEISIIFLDASAINKEKLLIAEALKSAREKLVEASNEKEKTEILKALVEGKNSVSEDILTAIERAVGEAAEAVSAAENVLKLLEREASSVSLVRTTVNPEGGTTGDISAAKRNAEQTLIAAQAAYAKAHKAVIDGGIATLIEIHAIEIPAIYSKAQEFATNADENKQRAEKAQTTAEGLVTIAQHTHGSDYPAQVDKLQEITNLLGTAVTPGDEVLTDQEETVRGAAENARVASESAAAAKDATLAATDLVKAKEHRDTAREEAAKAKTAREKAKTAEQNIATELKELVVLAYNSARTMKTDAEENLAKADVLEKLATDAHDILKQDTLHITPFTQEQKDWGPHATDEAERAKDDTTDLISGIDSLIHLLESEKSELNKWTPGKTEENKTLIKSLVDDAPSLDDARNAIKAQNIPLTTSWFRAKDTAKGAVEIAFGMNNVDMDAVVTRAMANEKFRDNARQEATDAETEATAAEIADGEAQQAKAAAETANLTQEADTQVTTATTQAGNAHTKAGEARSAATAAYAASRKVLIAADQTAAENKKDEAEQAAGTAEQARIAAETARDNAQQAKSDADGQSIRPPISIASAEDLAKIGNDSKFPLYRNYILTTNISLAGRVWIPIGSSSDAINPMNPFTGNFDGNKKTISSLIIKMSTRHHVGLFAQLGSDAQPTPRIVKDLTIYVDQIEGYGYVGALAGASHAEIKNVTVQSGSISGGTSVGGLVGRLLKNANIHNSTATTSIIGTSDIGGLVGKMDPRSKIENSYATGSVSGVTSEGGGLVGNMDSSSEIKNSYATGSVNGTSKVGGLVGNMDSSSKIENSYATGSVNGTSKVGGLVGNMDSSSEIKNSYATGSVSGTSEAGGLVGKINGSANTSTSSYFDESGSGYTNAVGAGNASGIEGVSASRNIIEKNGGYYDTKDILDANDDVEIFIAWDFAAVWQRTGNGQWPTLK